MIFVMQIFKPLINDPCDAIFGFDGQENTLVEDTQF